MPTEAIRRSQEYRAIAAHYGDRCARRSGVRLMQHIDEGLAILAELGASARAMRAWCLHPLVQDDAALAAADLSALTDDVAVMALAMEYRSVANAYLSPMGERDPADIRLSVLPEVNDMLRADKVQNHKDFLLYHHGTHPRSDALSRYFQAWLTRLGVWEQREALSAVAQRGRM